MTSASLSPVDSTPTDPPACTFVFFAPTVPVPILATAVSSSTYEPIDVPTAIFEVPAERAPAIMRVLVPTVVASLKSPATLIVQPSPMRAWMSLKPKIMAMLPDTETFDTPPATLPEMASA